MEGKVGNPDTLDLSPYKKSGHPVRLSIPTHHGGQSTQQNMSQAETVDPPSPSLPVPKTMDPPFPFVENGYSHQGDQQPEK